MISSGFIHSGYNNTNTDVLISSDIPVPLWEIVGKSTYLTLDNISFLGDVVNVRIPFLEDINNLYVQFGRIKSRTYHNRPTPKYKGIGIRWYSSFNGSQTIGSGFLGGTHNNTSKPRLNTLPINAQNELISHLPYYNFYRMAKISVYNPNTLSNYTINVPHMTGGKIIKNRDLNNQLSGSTYYHNRLKNNNFHDIPHMNIEWYCRIIKIVNNRLIAIGNTSNALITKPNPIGFDDFKREVTLYKFTNIKAHIEN